MTFDTLIRGAQVVDGSGGAPFLADAAFLGGKIAALGELNGAEAQTVIDARGRVLTPGFLDIHRHADAALFRPDFGACELAQGLTTIVSGNCGMSLAPMTGEHAALAAGYLAPVTGELPPELRFASFQDYFRAAESAALPLHCATLAGMGTLRACIAGFSGGDLDAAQERALHRLLERALSGGALGVSLGLGYAPEIFYSTAGLIRALAPLAGSGVPITVHMRQEGDGVVDALREMLAVARALKTPMEISHLKAIGRRNWRCAVPEMLAMLARAREEGLDVACDVYPYAAGSTQLLHVLPPEFQADGALTRALRSPSQRREMRERMESGRDFENIIDLVGFDNVLATGLRRPEHRAYEGRSLSEIAREQGKDPFDALFDLLAAEDCTPSMIDFIADEADIEAILRAPFSTVISDATYPTNGLLHPRVCGSFARLLETYVEKKNTLTLARAVHKVTMQSAERLGLRNKGRIAVGADADALVFDPARIRENGTWSAPRQLASGMDYVFVGGCAAIADGALTGNANGRMLRR